MVRIFRALPKGIACLTALFLLSACENPYLVKMKKEFGWTEARMTRNGWLESRKIPAPKIYCYETIGEAECFEAPDEAQQHRLVKQTEIPEASASEDRPRQ